jgi:uncharacterized surface protein with fasciclin (FAS1) repeats
MKFIKRLLLIVFIAGTFTTCDKEEETVVVGDNLDTIINANADLSLFKAALVKTKLTTFTQGPGPFTIYAPSNVAFNAMGVNSEADLNLIDSSLLATILTNHLHAGLRTSYEIPVGPNGTISTLGGFTVYASKTPANVAYINGGKLLQIDIKASNGTMHIIEKVLLPPLTTTLGNLALIPNAKLFLQAINKAGATSSFATNPATVFAPTNAAMVAAGYDSTSIANASAATITLLGNIVKYHVINSRIFSNDFKDGNLKTAQGTNIVISAGGTKIKGTSNPSAYNIIIKNVVSSTGVIHQIDGLLLF